jgi:branched-chain amino acid transport system substrate-binding protein
MEFLQKGAHDMNAKKLAVRPLRHLVSAVLLPGMLTFCLMGCGEKEPIRVGLVAQLTGVQAELGVQERNGAQLAVEEINAAGGIDGRSIELIIRDDLGTPEGAQAADRELIDMGVVAIIGHPTSSQTLAGLAVTNPAHVVMLSPTTSTTELSGKDDYFFRLAETVLTQANHFAPHIYQDLKIDRIAVIYDTDNAAYTKSYLKAFMEKYQSLDGKVVAEVGFSSKTQPDFTPLVTQLQAGNPGGLLIIAADIDTALIAQRIRLVGWQIPLFTTSWAQTETLINNGGQAVEGMEIELTSALNNQEPAYLDFVTRYQARFGRVPSFGAVLGYETAKVLEAALQKTGGKADGLRQALVGIHDFNGLSDLISFDKYGDVMRPIHLGVIRDGKYVSIEAMEPSKP